MNTYTNKYKIFSAPVIVFLAAFLIFGVSNHALADSRLSLAGLDIKPIEGAVIGFVKLVNVSDVSLHNLSFSLILEDLNGTVIVMQDELGSSPEPARTTVRSGGAGKFFSLMPKEELTENFVFLYPQNIKSGDYNLRISVLDFGGKPIANLFQKVALKGENKFLNIDLSSCKLILDKKEFTSQSGIPLYPGEPLKISCKVSNPDSSSVAITPVLRTKESSLFYSPQAPFSEITGKTLNFKPKESANVTLEFSGIPQKPQIYEAGLKFENEKGEQVSGYAIFRWLIKGAATTITSFELDKDVYKKGDIAKADVKFTVAPDMYFMYYPQFTPTSLKDDFFRVQGTILKNLFLAINLKSGEEECASAKPYFQDLEPSANNDYSKTVEITLEKNCRDPKAEIVLSQDNQILAAAVYQTKSPAEAPRAKINLFYVLIAAIAAAIVIIFLKIAKRKPPSKIVSSI